MLLGYTLAVHPELTLEHPVAGVLGVGLRDLEELHVGGVASQTTEDFRDELQVARVPTAPMTPVELAQGFHAQFEERDDLYRSRDETGLEGGQGLAITHLGHAIVQGPQDLLRLFVGDGRRQPDTRRPLQPANRADTRAVADLHGVRRPGRLEVQTRSVLQDGLEAAAEEAGRAELVRLEGLGEKVAKDAQPGIAEMGGAGLVVNLDVVAVLRVHLPDRATEDALSRGGERLDPSGSHAGCPVETQHGV